MEMNSSKGAWAGGIGQEAGMGCTPKKELDFLRALLHILSYLGDGCQLTHQHERETQGHPYE